MSSLKTKIGTTATWIIFAIQSIWRPKKYFEFKGLAFGRFKIVSILAVATIDVAEG
jgi:hypothetical protein